MVEVLHHDESQLVGGEWEEEFAVRSTGGLESPLSGRVHVRRMFGRRFCPESTFLNHCEVQLILVMTRPGCLCLWYQRRRRSEHSPRCILMDTRAVLTHNKPLSWRSPGAQVFHEWQSLTELCVMTNYLGGWIWILLEVGQGPSPPRGFTLAELGPGWDRTCFSKGRNAETQQSELSCEQERQKAFGHP